MDVDRPYLSGYAKAVMGLPDGPVLLGNMIASAESKAELLNYSPEDVQVATIGLLNTNPLHYFDKFVKRLAGDERLWPALVRTFSENIAGIESCLVQKGDELNIRILKNILNKYEDLGVAYEQAVSQLCSPAGEQGLLPEPP